VYGNDGNGAFYGTNFPRNVATTTVEGFLQSYNASWGGQICTKTLNQPCSDQEAIFLSSGQYRIQFSALKHFGNNTNPADFEVYRTPPFDLVY
jgi:hypothetical protein